MYRSILSLSKVAHQVWRDQPISQRNTTTVRAVGVGGDRKVGDGGGQILKKGVGNVRGALHKITGLTPLFQLCKETSKISHPPIIEPTPPPLQPFLKNFISPFPTFMRGALGGGGVQTMNSSQYVSYNT